MMMLRQDLMTRSDRTCDRNRPPEFEAESGWSVLMRGFGQPVATPRGIVGCSVGLWIGTLLIVSVTLVTSRIDAYDRAEQNARNLTLVLERDIRRSVDLYDLSLRAVAEGVANPRVMTLPADLRDQVLFDRSATAPHLGTIVVRDLSGNVLVDSGTVEPSGQHRASEAYPILQSRLTALGGLYLGHPAPLGGSTEALAIPLGRAVRDADGTVRGSVTGSLSLEYFRTLTGGLAIGKDGSVSIFETDGTMISRLPDSPANIGRDFSQTGVFRQLMAAPEGSFVARPKVDNVERLVVFKRLAGLPLIVVVAPAIETVYADWWRRAGWLALLVTLFTAAKAIGTFLLVRELRRRRAAEAELQSLAQRDPLTALANRRAFDDAIRREWGRAQREITPLSLLFIDIDQFKAYNDAYGHQAGDLALKVVARQIMSALTRPGDLVARYGGEEFVVILPNTELDGAVAVAEKIRLAIQAAGIEHRHSASGWVSASVGVSGLQSEGITDVDALVRAADAAVYRAKRQGRNQVCRSA